MMEQVRAGWQWVLSFFKSEWTLKDYPIRWREQGKNNPAIPRWTAQIINWWQMIGIGDTRQAAEQDLAARLQRVKQATEALPRPGTGLPIEFAPQTEIDQYWPIVSRILAEVLGYHPDEVFVSDESSLWDFAEGDDLAPYQQEIDRLFGVDVSPIKDGNLVKIAKAIHASQSA